MKIFIGVLEDDGASTDAQQLRWALESAPEFVKQAKLESGNARLNVFDVQNGDVIRFENINHQVLDNGQETL